MLACCARTSRRRSAAATDGALPLSRSARKEAAQRAQPAWIDDALAGIDQIDWHSPKHAYGSAEDVPRLVRMLASDDAEVRQDALDSLCGNIWHQGTVYQASAYAAPFLLRLLDDQHTPDRHHILDLLYTLATGNSYSVLIVRGDCRSCSSRVSRHAILAS